MTRPKGRMETAVAPPPIPSFLSSHQGQEELAPHLSHAAPLRSRSLPFPSPNKRNKISAFPILLRRRRRTAGTGDQERTTIPLAIAPLTDR